jgi:hypothetical protein
MAMRDSEPQTGYAADVNARIEGGSRNVRDR